ncbi:MAG TPA: tetratricopeptide repeat protein [Stellaceae bacterium]|nr:tetratricopeptide repeat protein [Stellaceae bacterium]
MTSVRTIVIADAVREAAAHYQARRFAEAAELYKAVLGARPGWVEIWCNLGAALQSLFQSREAITAYQRAIELDPGCAAAHGNMAVILLDQGQIGAAIASYRHALAASPSARIHSNLIYALDLDWRTPRQDADDERRRWYQAHRASDEARFKTWPNTREPARKLRVGYVSADFCRHSIAQILRPIVAGHDRAAFEVVCYSATAREDDWMAFFKAHADRWRPIADLDDAAAARLIREDAIDILVDASGHTAGNRLTLFTAKPAPIQVTAWGNLNGTQIPEIDYLLGDAVTFPRALRASFAETIVDLPCALMYGAPEDAPEVEPLPAPTAGRVTFGCLNRLSKLSDQALQVWSRILRAVPDSRLLLKDRTLSDPQQRAAMIERLARVGIGADQVVLHGATHHRDHLLVFGAVDVGLDPFPQHGGISTLEALWMGVPVISRRDDTLSSRVAASIMTTLGLTDFVVADDEAYVARAIACAADLEGLRALRASLRTRLRATAIADGTLYLAALEDAYRAMWQRWCDAAPTASAGR